MSEPMPAVDPVEATPVMTLDDLDDLGKVFLGKLHEFAKVVDEQQVIVDAGKSGNVESALILMRPSHPAFEDAETLRVQYETALATIDADNLPNVTVPSAEDVKAAEAVIATMQIKARDGVKFVMNNYPGIDPLIPKPFQRKATATKSLDGSGTQLPRPRLQYAAIRCDKPILAQSFEDESGAFKPTFTNLVNYVNAKVKGSTLTVELLKSHAFTVAGTQDLSTKAGEDIEFTVTVGENGNTAHLEFIVTPTKKA